jgi:hypothetical protein
MSALIPAPSGGGGGSSFANAHVLFVTKAGNDSTGDGSPAKPFLTPSAAYSGGVTAAVPFVIQLGVGDFTGAPLQVDSVSGMNPLCVGFLGFGIGTTFVSILATTGGTNDSNGNGGGSIIAEIHAITLNVSAAGGNATDDDGNSYTAGPGCIIYISGDGEIGSALNVGGGCFSGTAADNGGSGGTTTLVGVSVSKTATLGVAGGNGFNGGGNGNDGTFNFDGVRFGDLLTADPTFQAGNGNGTTNMGRCSHRSSLSISGTINDKGGNATW